MNPTPGTPPAKKRPVPAETCQLCRLPHKAEVLCVQAQQVAMKKLLEKCAVKIARCGSCPALIYFMRHEQNGVLAPYTEAGLNHFIDCPGAENHKGPQPRSENPR